MKLSGTDYALGCEPSVAQPPLPLQEFLPLQPASLVLQPPLPLQEFIPLQPCLSFFASLIVLEDCPANELDAEILDDDAPETVAALTRAIVPPSNPVKAAVNASELFEIFI
jgi:hypothetical protein